MIDTIDPNLNPPPAPPAAEVQPVEPIKAETVKVQEDKLEERKSQDEEDLRRRKKRSRKDTVELSSRPDGDPSAADNAVGEAGEQDKEQDEHKIDILI